MRKIILTAILGASLATGASAVAQTRRLEVIVFAGASALPTVNSKRWKRDR